MNAEQKARELLAEEYERKRCPLSARVIRNGDASVDQEAALRAIARALEQPVKPFPAPGAWFPTNVMGAPMREFAPGRWESATWPSEQPEGQEAVVGQVECSVPMSDGTFVVGVKSKVKLENGTTLYTTPPAKVPEPCQWTADDDGLHDYWETGCGRVFCFEDGGSPTGNNFFFCHGCGKPINIAAQQPKEGA